MSTSRQLTSQQKRDRKEFRQIKNLKIGEWVHTSYAPLYVIYIGKHYIFTIAWFWYMDSDNEMRKSNNDTKTKIFVWNKDGSAIAKDIKFKNLISPLTDTDNVGRRLLERADSREEAANSWGQNLDNFLLTEKKGKQLFINCKNDILEFDSVIKLSNDMITVNENKIDIKQIIKEELQKILKLEI